MSTTNTTLSRPLNPDPAVFARAYEEHHEALYRYCRSILRNDHDAHDALSCAITKAFAAWQQGPQVDELRPWLFRIAHNEAITLIRGRKTIPVAELPETATEGLELTAERRERLEHLDRDLCALPDNQRAAIVLRELNGLGHEEIAVVLQSTPRAVKQTIYEARVGLLDAEAGRGMSCTTIQHSISDGDKRVLRGRRVRGHLRSCPDCRGFERAMQLRTADLALLAPPLIPVSATLMLAHALGAGGASAVGTTAGLTGAGALTAGAGAAAPGVLGSAGGIVSAKGAAIAAAAVLSLGGGAAIEQARHPSRPTAPPPTGQATSAAAAPVPASSSPSRPAPLSATTTTSTPSRGLGPNASATASPKKSASASRAKAKKSQSAKAKIAKARTARAKANKAAQGKSSKSGAAKGANAKKTNSSSPSKPNGTATLAKTGGQRPRASSPATSTRGKGATAPGRVQKPPKAAKKG